MNIFYDNLILHLIEKCFDLNETCGGTVPEIIGRIISNWMIIYKSMLF